MSAIDRRREAKQKKRLKRLARRGKGRMRAIAEVPVTSFVGVAPSLPPSPSPGVAPAPSPSPGVAPAPSPVATKGMWSDPRVLLGVAAALILFLRPKKSS